MKSFDCTLREAGFLTGWHFTPEFAKSLYLFADFYQFDYLEIGFCHALNEQNLGIFRHCFSNISTINNIFAPIKNKTKIAAMIDMQRPQAAIVPKEATVIDAIRILTRSEQTDFRQLTALVSQLKKSGYEVFINFTNAGSNSLDLNQSFINFVASVDIPIIYFADTNSQLDEEKTRQIIDLTHKNQLKCGLHLHNKCGMSDKLQQLALTCQVDYLDFTLLGLGGKYKDGNLLSEDKIRLDKNYLNADYNRVKNLLIENICTYYCYNQTI